MIKINNFTFTYRPTANTRELKIISKCNVTINKGEKFALLGENGVGKTSVLNAIWTSSFMPSNETGVELGVNKAILSQEIWSDIPIDPAHIDCDYYSILWNHYLNAISNDSVFYIDGDTLTNWYSLVVSQLNPNFVSDLRTHLFDFQVSMGSLASEYDMLSPGTKKKILLSIVLASKPDSLLCD